MNTNQSFLRQNLFGVTTVALSFVGMHFLVSSQAASVIDPTGASYTGVSASSSFNASFGPANFFNFDVSSISPGATLADESDWATQSAMSAYVAFQLPTVHSVSALFFAQRDSQGRPEVDQMNLANIWASSAAPFNPNAPPQTAPDAILVLNANGNPVWSEHSLGSNIVGRYFLVQLVKTNGDCCNPGGREMRLGEEGVTSQVLSATPLSYWRFNETPGSTVAVDSMGNFDAAYGLDSALGNPGPRPPGFPGFSSANTALGTVMGDAASTVTIPALNLNTNTVTFLTWINPTGDQDPYATLLGWRDSQGAGYGVLAYGGQLGWIWNNWGWWETTGLTIPRDQWSMAAVVVTPSNGTIYLGANGRLLSYVSANPNSAALFDTPTTIGSEPNGTRVFNGGIDEFAIFQRALTAEELQRIYAAGVGQVPVEITQQPASRTNYVGGTARFTVVAAGSNPSFLWKKGSTVLVDGSNISGARTSTLSIANLTVQDAGNYSCIVSNAMGFVTSSSASLSVIPVPARSYDSAVLSYKPVAYWQLDEPAGATTTTEYWGSFDGTALPHALLGVNGPRSPEFPGFSGGNTALQTTMYDGNSSVAVPGLNLNANTASLLMWIYPLGSQAAFTSMFANRSGGYAAINYNGDAVTLSYQWNSWGWESGILIPSDQWSLMGLVIAPGSSTVYLGNGGVLTNNSQTIDNPALSFSGTSYIGSDSGNDTRVFNGVIDDVAFFNRSLSANEIATLYNTALGLPPVPPTLEWSVTPSGLVFTWYGPFNLIQSPSPAGPWAPAGVSSGTPIPMTGTDAFYRLQY